MNRTETSNLTDISTLTWITPSLFIDHAKLNGDYSNMVNDTPKDSIDLDRSGYNSDEKLFVQYLQNAITIVESYLPFDLQAKDYKVFLDPCPKFTIRGRIDTVIGSVIKFNDVLVSSDDVKIVDNVVYITEIDDTSGNSDGGSYIEETHTVLSVEPTPDILQALLYVFTFLFDNRGDCSGELCGCQPALNALRNYRTISC